MPREFCGPCSIIHVTLVNALCTRQLSSIQLRCSTRKQQEAGKQIKTEKLGEVAAAALEVPLVLVEALNDDERTLVDKLRCLEKKKRRVALEKKARQLDLEISCLYLSDDEEADNNDGQERTSRVCVQQECRKDDQHKEEGIRSASTDNSLVVRRLSRRLSRHRRQRKLRRSESLSSSSRLASAERHLRSKWSVR